MTAKTTLEKAVLPITDLEDPEVLARLRQERRLALPPKRDFWVFGYGSLMWHPGFPHLEVRPGRVFGFSRRFCIYSHHYRGTPERPGLVFGLDYGGSCRGLAYRVPHGEGEAVMEYLYDRELVTAVYIPRWVPVTTQDGVVRAATFVVDHAHRQYTGQLTMAETASLVIQGVGVQGSCGEYLANTVHHLEALGLQDRQLCRLLAEVERRRTPP